MSKVKKSNPTVATPIQKMTEKENPDFFFYLVLGFIILFIPVFQNKTALDITLFPRLTAVCTFLTMVFVYLMMKRPSWMNDNISVWRNPILPILISYLFVTAIAMFFAKQPVEGFFDFFKNLLFVSMIALLSLLFVCKPDWHTKIPWMVLLASVVALGIGAQQYIEKVLLSKGRLLKDGREDIYAVDGIMSHKNEYSNALMLMLPFLLYAIFRFKGVARLLAIIITSLQITMLLLLKTRAVWLGVLALGFITALFVVIDYKKMGIPKAWRNIVGTLLIGGIVSILVIYNLPTDSDEFSIVGRIQSITNMESWHNINRLKIWGATIELIKDNFWLGVGPGNWNMEYYTYVQGLFTGVEQTNWGRPHNDFLWVFAEKGFFGILFFVSFFLLLLFMCVQVWRKSEDKNSRILAILLMGGIISYIIISLFSFPIERINHQLYLALMASGIIALYHSVSDKPSSTSFSSIVLLPIAALLGFGSFYGFTAVDMEQHLKAARIARERKMYKVMLHEAKEAKNPFRLLDNNSSTAEEFVAGAYFNMGKYPEALEELNKGLDIFPNQIVMLGRKGEILVALKNYAEAEAVFEKGLKLVPKSKELLYNKGVCLYYQGKYKEALESMSKIPKKRRGKSIRKKIDFLQKVVEQEERTGKKLPPPNIK